MTTAKVCRIEWPNGLLELVYPGANGPADLRLTASNGSGTVVNFGDSTNLRELMTAIGNAIQDYESPSPFVAPAKAEPIKQKDYNLPIDLVPDEQERHYNRCAIPSIDFYRNAKLLCIECHGSVDMTIGGIPSARCYACTEAIRAFTAVNPAFKYHK